MWEWNSKMEPSAGATYYGNFNFGSSTNNPLDTGYGYANALLGVYQTYTEATNRAVPNAHWTELDWYVQDNWRVSQAASTIDYGLRFVHESPVTDDSRDILRLLSAALESGPGARAVPAGLVGRKVGGPESADRADHICVPDRHDHSRIRESGGRIRTSTASRERRLLHVPLPWSGAAAGLRVGPEGQRQDGHSRLGRTVLQPVHQQRSRERRSRPWYTRRCFVLQHHLRHLRRRPQTR